MSSVISNARYFDWAASAIPDPPGADGDGGPFGNPSSVHREGLRARNALEDARRRAAKALGVKADRVYFTSGGTESNALVLHSLLLKPGKQGLVLSAIEHPSVTENGLILDRLGHPLSWIHPNPEGIIDGEKLEKAFVKEKNPRLVSVMWVNNETGAVMDIPALVKAARNCSRTPLHFHSDLVQGIGKIPLDLENWDLDSASISAHKLGGPRGIGLLYLRRPLNPLYRGGGQEGGLRPGTENTAGALALARALEARTEKISQTYEEARRRLKRLMDGLEAIGGFTPIPKSRRASAENFSPFILQAAFRGIPGEVMVRSLDDAGFAVSTGSACSSRAAKRPVLEHMGLSESDTREGFRISQGWTSTDAGIDELVDAIGAIVKKLGQ